MGRLTFDVLDSWQEWDMQRNPWETDPDEYDPLSDPSYDDTPDLDLPVPPVRESVTDETLLRRLRELNDLLRTLSRQERVAK